METEVNYKGNIVRNIGLLAFSMLMVFQALGQSKSMLKVGDPAPPIKVFKWVKGNPIESFEKDKVYVMEFWATWCGPCKAAMPHLSELARKYAGKVTITGVDIWEKKGQPQEKELPAVMSFVKQMGKDMDYNVAMDNNNQDMANSWMTAAGLGGIPATFLIKDGKIAWIGHPMSLEPILAQVIAGTYNPKVFGDNYNKQAVDQQKQRTEIGKILNPIQEAKKAGDYKRVLALIDSSMAEISDKYPLYKGGVESIKFEALAETDIQKAIAFAKEWHKTAPGWANISVPKLFSEKDGLPVEAYSMGAEFIKETLLLPNVVAPLAYELQAKCYFKAGDSLNAIASQKKAIELGKLAIKEGKYKGSILEETIARFEKSLKEYESARGK